MTHKLVIHFAMARYWLLLTGFGVMPDVLTAAMPNKLATSTAQSLDDLTPLQSATSRS